jgi:hypothetical protein
MPKEDFSVDRTDYGEGYSVNLMYCGKGVCRMEHHKDALGSYIPNYNIQIPSCRDIADNVKGAMDFLEVLEAKKARNFEEALKEAGQYYGTIFEKMPPVMPSAFGFVTPRKPGINIPFCTEELTKAARQLNYLIMKTKYGSASIEVCGNRDFSHHKIDFQPVTEVRFDGYAWDIAGELKDLALEVGCVQEPDFLKEPLEEMLGYFRETVQANCTKV